MGLIKGETLIIHWFRHLPQIAMDWSDWTPFIQNHWYRKHYMKFVYLLQLIIFLIPFFFETRFTQMNMFTLILIGIFVFIIHEAIHIVIIKNKGDISLTFSGIFFWLHTNAVLSKTRFWFFMTSPFIVLSGVPAIMSLFTPSDLQSILLFVSWINALISGSDIVNSLLIATKPKNAIFCRGYYRVQSDQ